MIKGKKRKKRRLRFFLTLLAVIFVTTAVAGAGLLLAAHVLSKDREERWETPEELLARYMSYIPEKEYKKMYDMLDLQMSGGISQDAFITRNSAIYEGIEAKNMKITVTSYDKSRGTVGYESVFDTAAGTIRFQNSAQFVKGEDGYGLVWTDSLIFPKLRSADKVRLSTVQAERGEIVDRNGWVLAGKGVASSVGVVPGKLENRAESIRKLAELLDISEASIEQTLAASWVTDDAFVPLQMIPKVEQLDLMTMDPDEKTLEEQRRQESLLAIPGVMLTDTQVRTYPLGEAAAHLIGYVQGVTSEDLEEHAGEGYTSGSVIGKSGVEALYEKELKGQNGCRIYIADEDGNMKEELAYLPVENGQRVELTIDARLQRALYEQFREDKGCSVAMDPYTGEVLALVSTPSYDNNDFIMGLTDAQWTSLNENEDKPMYNRFRQTWCPGSSFKPVTAAIGLQSAALGLTEDLGNDGRRWQKDESWGSYFVTTLHPCEPATMEKALISSDNIYFAKAALRIGVDEMQNYMDRLGFNEDLPFEIGMRQSQYSNTEQIETEVQLADSGYGQGQMLINPLHLACMYTAFANGGNIVQPYLTVGQKRDNLYWLREVFSRETAEQVLDMMVQVVSDPEGTGQAAYREDIRLAAKTGTAEIKVSQGDKNGTELGWFAIFTADRDEERPILLVSMIEDVKDRGGSGYVVRGDKEVLDAWFAGF
ncbi:penicillin-binding transpeptidase domain-containing protein [Lachnospiraceae bacterium 47-T17]